MNHKGKFENKFMKNSIERQEYLAGHGDTHI
jgi:hypothetical protein